MASGQWWLIGFLPIGGSAQYEVFQGTQAEAQAKEKLAVNGTLHGPFATEADAKAAEKNLPTSIQQTPTGAEQAIGISNPLSGLAAIGAALAKAVGYLSDLAMWRSLGWLLLGAVMIVLGIILWLKKDNFLPSVVPVPV